MEARAKLAAEGIPSRVVSMPSWTLFEEQPEDYRRKVLGPGTVKVAIEAAVREGWDRYIGSELLGIGGRLHRHAQLSAPAGPTRTFMTSSALPRMRRLRRRRGC